MCANINLLHRDAVEEKSLLEPGKTTQLGTTINGVERNHLEGPHDPHYPLSL